MGMKIVREDMDEIDWEAMQDDLDLEEVEAMARQSEVWLLKAEVTKLKDMLEESEWERERLKRRLEEKEEARMAEEERSERYMKKCEFFMEYSKSITKEMHTKKASFLEMAIARKKKKKTILVVNQERVTQKMNPKLQSMNQKLPNWRQKKYQMSPWSMTRTVKEKNLPRTQVWPGVWRAL